MCELLGMSANQPVNTGFSWRGFKQRGGCDGPHCDGFGVGFYRRDGYHDFHDVRAAIDSPLAELLGQDDIAALIMMGHLRHANEGGVEIQNTYPFTRKMEGRHWCYTMQGQLEGFETLRLSGRFTPLGSTDGEHVFCWLLDQLAQQDCDDVSATCGLLARCGDQLAQMGVFNMMLSDGRVLYTYCSKKMCWLTRRAPFGTVTSLDNGEHIDLANRCDSATVYTLLATNPLTNESGWQDMHPGEAMAFCDGEQCDVVTPQAMSA
ncbi:class II glutamine amidotransferase [Kushneria sp. Sum13]|uniref:class II glutamine amidotransferase n=1 Tax=Kushneria sp. Sum13 TaxID=3459196 RepID=UPI0040458D38